MIKRVIFSILLFSALSAQPQSFDIYGFSGYTFSDRFNITGGDAKVFGGFTYGGGLSYSIYDDYEVDISYFRLESRVTANSIYNNIDVDESVNMSWIVAGGHRLFSISDNLTTYSGLKFGVINYNSPLNKFPTITRFTAGVEGGAKLLLTDYLGLRFNMSLFMPISNINSGLWWSNTGGTSVSVSSSVPFVHFGLNGGVFVRI